VPPFLFQVSFKSVDDSAGAGAPGNGIEITLAMIEAGYEALASRYFDLVDSFGYREIARTVFEAMAAKIEKSHRGDCQSG
jgi:hypothetical protein